MLITSIVYTRKHMHPYWLAAKTQSVCVVVNIAAGFQAILHS